MVQIRPAGVEDEARLFELVCAFPTPTPPGAASFKDALSAKLPDPSSYVALAEQDAAIVGYVAGYCHPTFYANGSTAWVDELLVDPALRRRGVGRKLMEAFETWAVSRGCTLVSLATSTAGSFYARLGYATKASYYKKYLTHVR